MLNSWFSSRSSRHSQRSNPPPVPDNAQSDVSSEVSQSTVGPLRTPGNLTSASDVPLDEVHTHINDPSVYAPTTTPSLTHSAEKATTSSTDPRGSARQASAPERLEETLYTPQDAMIAQVFGRPATDAAHATPPPPRQSVSFMTSDSLPPPPSLRPEPSSSVRLGPALPIYEPFSGVKLGERTPTATVPGEDDRRLWSSLERVLELQAEVAAMHADMEGVSARAYTGSVGTGEGGNVSRKSSRRGETLLVGDEETEEQGPEGGATGPAVSEIFTDHSDGEDEDEDDRDEDEDGIHGYGKKRRDEEFSRLAEQFAQRKVAIGGIMNKLDDLSTALKTFHALPPPLLDLAMSASRTDTTSSTPSNVSVMSSSPRVYFGQPSSPPVPLISTLAPPEPPERVIPGFAAPVLPRTTVPMIPGASHVESPADINLAQSTRRR